jgi:putative phosphoesterase
MPGVHRIALISDIHGNAIALDTVLSEIRARGCDEIVCLGDVATLGIAPVEVLARLRELGCRCVRGNHEDYLIDPALSDQHTQSGPVREAIEWCRRQLSAAEIDFLSSFEARFELPLGGGRSMLLYHGTPSSNTTNLLAETPVAEFDALLGEERREVMAGGHTHVQMLRQHKGTLVINPGSVGAPFREYPIDGPPTIMPHAEYASLDVSADSISVNLHRVALDPQAMRAAIRASKNPLAPALLAPYIA